MSMKSKIERCINQGQITSIQKGLTLREYSNAISSRGDGQSCILLGQEDKTERKLTFTSFKGQGSCL